MEELIEIYNLENARHTRLAIFAGLLNHECDLKTQIDILTAEVENMQSESEVEGHFLKL